MAKGEGDELIKTLPFELAEISSGWVFFFSFLSFFF